MPKNIEDIIVPDRRRSIREIPIPAGRRKTDPARRANMSGVRKAAPLEEFAPTRAPSSPPPIRTVQDLPPPRRRTSRKKVWLSGILALTILAFAVLSMLNGATLSYVPKSAALSFDNETYTAQKTGTSGLFYSVVKLSRDKGMIAPAGREEQVSRKASGTIIVYNDNADAQRLVENTRFESPSGKIYKIQSAINVPAKRTVNGDNQPGTVEATVYADVAGESYNSGPTDFTVPGLKGTARFSTVYARSKTPIAGGFVGVEKVVKSEDLTKAKAELQVALRNELYSEAEAEVPQDFILFRTLATFDFEDLPQTVGENSSVTVNQRGHLYGVMFKRSDLAKFLAQKKLSLASTDSVEIASYAALNPVFASTPPADLLSLNEVNFKITGSALLVWLTDEVSLKADLLGRHKDDVAGILINYPTISSASVTVRPFWKSSLPKEAEKITVNKLKAE